MAWDNTRDWDSHPWDLWECHIYVINSEEEHARIEREERLALRRAISRAKKAIQRATGNRADAEMAREYIRHQRWFGLGAPADKWWERHQRDQKKAAEQAAALAATPPARHR